MKFKENGMFYQEIATFTFKDGKEVILRMGSPIIGDGKDNCDEPSAKWSLCLK